MLFSFIFVNKVIAQPTVNMVSVTDSITSYGVRMKGIIPSKGGWTITSYGFIYDTLPMPTRATGAKIIKLTATLNENVPFSTFPSSSYMLSGKTYYIRAYAAKSATTSPATPADTVFSSPLSVSIPMPIPPTIKMDSVRDIMLQSANLYGIVLAKNDVNAFSGQGFVYSSTQSMPTINNSTRVILSGNITSSLPDTLSSQISNLVSGQEYKVRFYVLLKYRNTNNRVDTTYSDTIKFRTLHACGSVPTDVNVDNVTTTTARVSFTPGLAQVAWQLDYDYAGHTPGTGTQVTTTNDTVDISGLIGNQSYSIFVRAVCGDTMYSDWSIIKTFTTSPYPCAPITNIYVTEVRHSSAQISWTPGAISQNRWEVLFAKSSENFPNNGTITTQPTISLVGLTPQTQYKLKVRALCNDLLSDWSTEYVFSTTVSGIEDEEKEDIEKVIIYPNPTNGTINFKSDSKEKITKVEIWSSLGEIIYTSNKLPETYTLINQTKGLFLVKIFSNDYVQIEKVVLN